MTATIEETTVSHSPITEDDLNLLFDLEVEEPCDWHGWYKCDQAAEWMIYGTPCPGCGYINKFVCDRHKENLMLLNNSQVICGRCKTFGWIYRIHHMERIKNVEG